MNKKQVIRLTESQFKQIVMESVKNILEEGKVVNHKPYFVKRNDKPAQPGDYADFLHNIQYSKQHRSDDSHTRVNGMLDYYNALDKHNARRNNYIRKEPNSDSHLVHIASKEGEESKQKERLMNRKESARTQREFKEMLRFNGVSSEEYNTLSKSDREEMWNNYYRYGSPAYDKPSAIWVDGGEYSSGWLPSGRGEY